MPYFYPEIYARANLGLGLILFLRLGPEALRSEATALFFGATDNAIWGWGARHYILY